MCKSYTLQVIPCVRDGAIIHSTNQLDELNEAEAARCEIEGHPIMILYVPSWAYKKTYSP